MSDMSRSGMDRMKENLKALKQTVIGSFLRSGRPTSDRSRAAVMFNNFPPRAGGQDARQYAQAGVHAGSPGWRHSSCS